MSHFSDKADVHFAPSWDRYLESVAKSSALRISKDFQGANMENNLKNSKCHTSVVNYIQSNCLK